ncbi:right-handed parallel beta-helix repeat-containing protein [Paenibacillus sp. y28]|uniref:right-handed parallel beta-helix repeat-containing protein n=1 Tax=Paenibacillus sp. y28 TaxID=3129110 RepID=UPI00301AD23A
MATQKIWNGSEWVELKQNGTAVVGIEIDATDQKLKVYNEKGIKLDVNNTTIASMNDTTFSIHGDTLITGEATVQGELNVSGDVKASRFFGDLTGNSATATKLETTRQIELTGAVTGTGYFDGSGNISISTTSNNNASKGRTSTLIVAASNASEKSKDGADYVCSGQNDQIQIQEAINYLSQNTESGGAIFLTEGIYKISGAIRLYPSYTNGSKPVQIIGAGMGVTTLRRWGAQFGPLIDITSDGWESTDSLNYLIGNFSIDGMNIFYTSAQYPNLAGITIAAGGTMHSTQLIEKIQFLNHQMAGIYINESSQGLIIKDCHFANAGSTMIYNVSGAEVTIRDCFFRGTGMVDNGIAAEGERTIIDRCLFKNLATGVKMMSAGRITNCDFIQNTKTIDDLSGGGSLISNNYIQ